MIRRKIKKKKEREKNPKFEKVNEKKIFKNFFFLGGGVVFGRMQFQCGPYTSRWP